MPAGTITTGRNRGNLSYVAVGIVPQQVSRFQINDATGGVQNPCVRVPYLRSRGVPPIAAGEGFDSCDCLGRQQAPRSPIMVDCFTANDSCLVIDFERAFALPLLAIPMKPGAPHRNVAKGVRMTSAEFEREPILAELSISVQPPQLFNFLGDFGICAPDRTLRRHGAHPWDDAYRRRKRARP
jgi:hypothetical protein